MGLRKAWEIGNGVVGGPTKKIALIHCWIEIRP